MLRVHRMGAAATPTECTGGHQGACTRAFLRALGVHALHRYEQGGKGRLHPTLHFCFLIQGD